jgi:hypothetical protein
MGTTDDGTISMVPDPDSLERPDPHNRGKVILSTMALIAAAAAVISCLAGAWATPDGELDLRVGLLVFGFVFLAEFWGYVTFRRVVRRTRRHLGNRTT